jgi:hypothetical protein
VPDQKTDLLNPKDDQLKAKANKGDFAPGISPAKSYIEMTNLELRAATESYITRSRKFNSEARRADQRAREIDDAQFSAIPRDEEHEAERNKVWKTNSKKMVARHKYFETTFTNNFLTDAKLFNAALKRKVDPQAFIDLPVQEQEEHIIALSGSVAGPDPLADLANYLEYLARQLPPDG